MTGRRACGWSPWRWCCGSRSRAWCSSASLLPRVIVPPPQQTCRRSPPRRRCNVPNFKTIRTRQRRHAHGSRHRGCQQRNRRQLSGERCCRRRRDDRRDTSAAIPRSRLRQCPSACWSDMTGGNGESADGHGPAPDSSVSSSRIAPALSRGSLPLPHFGDCTHDGQPVSHAHAAIASRVAVSQVAAAS